MDDQQLARYSRHVLLPEIGGEGQRRLLRSRVMIVGMGGLGSPAAMYLAASGIGHLVLVDFDHVELSNLQRQVIHGTADLGRNKVDSARDAIKILNPEVQVSSLARALDETELIAELQGIDVVVDASDNFETRFELNAACVKTRTPLVSGAAIRMEAQVSVFQPALPESPCYRCLYNDDSGEGDACAQTGVLAPLLGIIGSIQATETLKILLHMGTTLTGRVLILDALHMEWQILKLRRDPQCPVCKARRPAK